MKTLKDFNNEISDCQCLEDFVLSTKEWNEFESGTKAIRVKTFSGNTGNLVNREYVLMDIDNMEDVLEDMQAVAPGYYTEIHSVVRK